MGKMHLLFGMVLFAVSAWAMDMHSPTLIKVPFTITDAPAPVDWLPQTEAQVYTDAYINQWVHRLDMIESPDASFPSPPRSLTVDQRKHTILDWMKKELVYPLQKWHIDTDTRTPGYPPFAPPVDGEGRPISPYALDMPRFVQNQMELVCQEDYGIYLDLKECAVQHGRASWYRHLYLMGFVFTRRNANYALAQKDAVSLAILFWLGVPTEGFDQHDVHVRVAMALFTRKSEHLDAVDEKGISVLQFVLQAQRFDLAFHLLFCGASADFHVVYPPPILLAMRARTTPFLPVHDLYINALQQRFILKTSNLGLNDGTSLLSIAIQGASAKNVKLLVCRMKSAQVVFDESEVLYLTALLRQQDGLYIANLLDAVGISPLASVDMLFSSASMIDEACQRSFVLFLRSKSHYRQLVLNMEHRANRENHYALMHLLAATGLKTDVLAQPLLSPF